MAIIGERKISFVPSASEDVIGYRIRFVAVQEDLEQVIEDKAYFKSLPFHQADNPIPSDDGRIRLSLSSMDNTPDESGVYNILISAIDGSNESAPLVIANANLDFDPPQAPTDGMLE